MMQKGQALELVSKRACLLNPNQISELIMDSKSVESQCDRVTSENEKCCKEVLLEPYLQLHQVPVLRLHSSWIQPLPLKMRIMVRVGQNHRHNCHLTHSGHCPLAYRREQYTHLQGAPDERMTVKHHSAITALLHFVFSCCILHSLF